MKLRQLYESAKIESFVDYLTRKYTPKDLNVFEYRDKIRIQSIIINKDAQSKGTGSKIMDELCKFADSENKIITLTPAQKDPHHGTTSQSRLIDFYKRFGFILNKGRHINFEIIDLMYRLPE